MAQRPTLETKRLLLRPFEMSDSTDVRCLAGDRAIADTTVNIPHPYEDGMAEDWISKQQDIFSKGEGIDFAITMKSGGTLVGAISLLGVVKEHQAELGYWIGRPYWNKGICTEAGLSVVQYGFEELGLNRIHAAHFSRNKASGRVIQKLGTMHEGCRKQHVKKWDHFEDLELYGLMKEDWSDL
jgi:RimJ/RimL family protein N-acetyltransferase